MKLLTKAQQNKTTAIEDKGGNLLTESSEVLNIWAECCKELYIFPIQPDTSILEREKRPPVEPSPLPIMREEVEAATRSLPSDKSSGADNITSHTSLAKTLLQGNLEDDRKRGRQAKCWTDNLKEWTRLDSPTMTRLAEDRPAWRSLSYNVSTMSPLRLPSQGIE